MDSRQKGRTNIDVKDSYIQELLEYFLVSAISSLLIIRLFLALTGFPQVGGDGLHIAHMLWGGLFMLVAVLMALTSTSQKVKTYIAIIGGIGFGTFIDETGKFITSNNDYFFHPTIALIYVIFVSLFLSFRFINLKRKSHKLSITHELVESKNIYYSVSRGFFRHYGNFINYPITAKIILAYFVLNSLLNLFFVSLIILKLPEISQINPILSVNIVFILVNGFLIILSLLFYVRKKYHSTYKFLLTANFISLFILQFFQFWEDQFFALVGLILNITIYIVLRSLIRNPMVKK